MARRPTMCAVVLAGFVSLTLAACQGAGAIPANQAQLLAAELAQIPPQVDAHACADIQTNSLPRIEHQVATLPNNVSADLRQTLAASTQHLRSLVASECLAPAPPPPAIYTPPSTTQSTTPPRSTSTETVNPRANLAPPPPSAHTTTQTKPPKTQPKPSAPKTDTPGNGGGDTSSGSGNSQGSNAQSGQDTQHNQDQNTDSNNDQQGPSH
jgi:hypothetical protein